jgi:hypothetical protein
MTPVKIVAENFKGRDFTCELKKVNLFTGPNESGKTAHIRAALIALLGYDPAIGKQPSATFGYASEMKTTPLTVHMEFDDGSFVTRTFTRNSKGEVSRSIKGTEPKVPEVLFNASDYLKATEQERIKMVFEKIDVSQITISDADLLSELGKIEVTPIAVCNQVLIELNTFANESLKRRTNLKQTTQAWLEELVKGLQERGKGEAGLLKGASGELTALKPAGKTPESQAPKIEAVKKLVAQREQAMNTLQTELATHNRLTSRKETLQAELAKPAIDTSALEKEIEAIQEKITNFKSSTPELQRNIEAFEKEITTTKTKLGESNENQADLSRQIEELVGKVKCPYCKSNRQGWKEEHAIELNEQLTSAAKITTSLVDRIAWLRDQLAGLKTDLALAQKADAQHAKDCINRVNLKNQLAELKAKSPDRSALEGELKGLNQVEKPSDDAIRQATDWLAAARKELETLQTSEILFTQFQANAGKFRECEAKLIRHQVASEVYKRAAQLVIAEQNEIVTKAFDSILAPARRFTDGIIGGQLTYQNGTLGVITDLGFVEHKFMAESRKQLLYLGLQVALAQQSPVKAIFLDELGIFDADSKVMVINRFLELAKEGFIHIALTADPDATAYKGIKDSDFQIIHLEK